MDDTERFVVTVKAKRKENGGLGACGKKTEVWGLAERKRRSGGLPQEKRFRTMPSRTLENGLLEHKRALLSSFILFSERKKIP